MASREVLKYSQVEMIYLVDLDPEITRLGRHDYNLKRLNKGSLDDQRVTVINEDAFVFLDKNQRFFDVIIADLPDPNNVSLARLYSKEFFKLIKSRLSKTGIFVTQATSPFFATKAFWCIKNTIAEAGFSKVIPYHVNVPSFGDWGFVMAANINYRKSAINISVPTRFL